jgi:hypothetical protein
MQGWSLFKLGRIEDALKPFFGVLDAKLGRLDTADRDSPTWPRVRAEPRRPRTGGRQLPRAEPAAWPACKAPRAPTPR